MAVNIQGITTITGIQSIIISGGGPPVAPA